MEQLPNIKTKNGYTYKLIKRPDKAAMYGLYLDLPQFIDINEDPYSYEVSKVTIQRAAVINGDHIPKKEKFSPNEDFGMTAWAYKMIDQANTKYGFLNEAVYFFHLLQSF